MMGWMQFSTEGFGYITDFEALFFWPLLFTGLGWLLVGLPLVRLLYLWRVQSFFAVVMFSTLATTLGFLALAALMQFGIIFMIWWPVCIGLIGGSVYWLLSRYEPLSAWIWGTVPILFFPFVVYVLYPVGLLWFPYTTFILMEGAVGPEAEFAVIEQVKVGDSYQDLQRRYPEFFQGPSLSKSYSWGNIEWYYRIEFDRPGGRVTKVEVIRGD